MFLVSVASKELSLAVSLLFATLPRRSISVASKGLTSHKICAVLGDLGNRDGRRGRTAEAATDVPER
jgi:hypothetical protein